MMKYGTVVVVLAASLFASHVVAAEMDAVTMKDGKMIAMKDGKATGPLDHEMTTTNGGKVMPDGTLKTPDGKETRMKEGQMIALDGKMTEGGMGMGMDMMKEGKGMGMDMMKKGKGMKME